MLKRCLLLFLFWWKNFSHKGENVRFEFVRKRNAILGFGPLGVWKVEWEGISEVWRGRVVWYWGARTKKKGRERKME